MLTHRGMSRQRKSRKFTYSLLSPGTFLFLLLLILSPFPQHLQLALTCCIFPFFFPSFFASNASGWQNLGCQKWSRDEVAKEGERDLHGDAFPHVSLSAWEGISSRRRAGDSLSAGNIWLLCGFISTLGKEKPDSPAMGLYSFPKGHTLVEKEDNHHYMGSLHYLFLNSRVLGAVTRGCVVQRGMK